MRLACAAPLTAPDGTVLGSVATVRDITDLHRQQEALREREARYRTIFDEAAVSLWEEDFSAVFALLATLKAQGVTDIAGYLTAPPEVVRDAARLVRVIEVNPASVHLFGARSTAELLGAIDRTFAPDSFRVFQDELVAFAAGHHTFSAETPVQTLAGERRMVQLTVTLFAPAEQPTHRALITMSDLTARKQAEDARERVLVELQRINAEFQQFSHIVSHDLNEPLRTMRNFVQLLARALKGKLEGDTEEYMAFVTDAAQRMQQMLTDLLAYTRAGQTPAFQAVDCEAILSQVLAALHTRITECDAIITHDSLPTVRGDATRLGQVLQNLIGNTLKFREAKPPRIHVAAVKEDTRWRFAVRDNGIGIDPRQTERLFQVFQRLLTRSEYAGSGIGSAICKRIVEQHGGRIWVESKPRAGSIFYFTISESKEKGSSRHSRLVTS